MPKKLIEIKELMDCAKAITGSDAATAREIGITRAAAWAIRHRGSISPDVARRLAELLETSPLVVIAAAEIAKHPEKRANWE